MYTAWAKYSFSVKLGSACSDHMQITFSQESNCSYFRHSMKVCFTAGKRTSVHVGQEVVGFLSGRVS